MPTGWWAVEKDFPMQVKKRHCRRPRSTSSSSPTSSTDSNSTDCSDQSTAHHIRQPKKRHKTTPRYHCRQLLVHIKDKMKKLSVASSPPLPERYPLPKRYWARIGEGKYISLIPKYLRLPIKPNSQKEQLLAQRVGLKCGTDMSWLSPQSSGDDQVSDTHEYSISGIPNRSLPSIRLLLQTENS